MRINVSVYYAFPPDKHCMEVNEFRYGQRTNIDRYHGNETTTITLN